MMHDIEPVILAGGSGTRLWPLSRRDRPKAFVSPDGGPTLLQRTWERARLLAPAPRIWVAAEERLAGLAAEQLPDLRPDRLLVEAHARDTGPAAAHAAWRVERHRPGAIVALLPADHSVAAPDRFVEAIAAAAGVADEEGALVCLGVLPSGPSTAYGYVECAGSVPTHARAVRVARFLEKPDAARARDLLAGGLCLWNAGIFVWRARAFLDEARRCWPEIGPALDLLDAGAAPARFFDAAPAIAVDRAVMERTGRAWTVRADMGWDDVGSWDALGARLPADGAGNRGAGDRLALEAAGCVVHSPGKPVVLVGVRDLIVVECDDVLLVAGREAAEQVRRVPAALAARGLERLA
jgi:mannose-1-phosphate guanylyltransferase